MLDSLKVLIVSILLCLSTDVAAQTVNVDSLFFKARDYAFQQKNYDAAIPLLIQIRSQSPNYTDASVLLGRIYFWIGSPDEGESILREVIASEPDRADAWAGLASGLLGEDKPGEALIIAERGLNYHGSDVVIMQQRAYALGDLGRFDEAVRQLDALLIQDPNADNMLWLRRDYLRRSKSSRLKVHGMQEYSSLSENFFDKERSVYMIGFESRQRKTNIAVNFYHSSISTISDSQLELEVVPIFGKSWYGYLVAARSFDQSIYPKYRLGGSAFYTGIKAIELELGVRYFDLPIENITVFTGSVGWYNQKWFSRAQLFAQNTNDESDVSINMMVRRYLDSSNLDHYASLTFGQGYRNTEPNDALDLFGVQSLHAGIDVQFPLYHDLYVHPGVRIQRYKQGNSTFYLFQASLGAYIRF